MEVIRTGFLVLVVMAANAAANVIPDAQLAAPAREEGAAEIDPNKLIRKKTSRSRISWGYGKVL